MGSITQWEPRRELARFTSGMERLFEELLHQQPDEENVLTASWSPAVDIRETKETLEVTAELAGIDPKDVEVTVDNDMLCIRGERVFEKGGDDTAFRRLERAYGVFERRFALPGTVNVKGISAHCRNGLLVLTLPKREDARPRAVNVEIEKD